MSICPHCNGTGRDAAKTARAIISGFIPKDSWVRCWSCHGNGNDTLADFYASLNRPITTPESTQNASQ